nr:odorant receptor 35 [Papilio memnon]
MNWNFIYNIYFFLTFRQSPKDQTFYRNFSTLITSLHLGNREWWGYKKPNKFQTFHRKLVLIVAPICVVSQIIYVLFNYKTIPFSTFSIIISIFPVSIVTNACIFSAQFTSFEKIMKLFMEKIHLYNYKDINELTRQNAVKVERYTRLAICFLTFSLLTDGLLWIIVPLRHISQNVEEIKNQTVMLQTLLYIWMPYDYNYNIRNWVITHVINSYVCVTGCIIIIVFNSLNYMFVFHIIGHIQMFKHKCKTEFLDALSDNATRDKLISLIKEHSFIIEMFNDMKHAFGYNVTGNYCHNLLSDSFLLYQIMFGNKEDWLLYGLMVFVYLGGLIVMSLVLEEIRRQSDDIADDVYSIPWENMSISNQKILMMMLARAQPPLEFISAGGLRAGVQPTISTIKSTFTYYVMLKTNIKVNQ